MLSPAFTKLPPAFTELPPAFTELPLFLPSCYTGVFMWDTQKLNFAWIFCFLSMVFCMFLVPVPIPRGESFAAVEADACPHTAHVPGSARAPATLLLLGGCRTPVGCLK